ncbi:MAG: 1,4-dihydroxy-2-naphthoate polyprenyltransferase [Burkholderiaceae bacterium]
MATKPSSWLMAVRPRTLSLSITPVVVGTTLAWTIQRNIHWLPVVMALLGSTLIQIGTNLHNDAGDWARGADRSDRVGPARVMASGLLSGTAVRRAAAFSFGGAVLIGLYLVFVGGWPILLLGLLSILSGWAYTGGPWPIAYTPLGELFVLAFFGPGAVCGTYWLCTEHLGAESIECGFAVGLFTAGVLLVNNRRDVNADARAGRRTLPIAAGLGATNRIYAGLMLLPFVLLFPLAGDLPRTHVWLPLIALPLALALIDRFEHEPRDQGFNRILIQTVQIQLTFSLLLCVGLVL